MPTPSMKRHQHRVPITALALRPKDIDWLMAPTIMMPSTTPAQYAPDQLSECSSGVLLRATMPARRAGRGGRIAHHTQTCARTCHPGGRRRPGRTASRRGPHRCMPACASAAAAARSCGAAAKLFQVVGQVKGTPDGGVQVDRQHARANVVRKFPGAVLVVDSTQHARQQRNPARWDAGMQEAHQPTP